ncbi:MAG: electron transport complex subunit E [Oscillospiraceae bacterium]|nr:electron transport complex subunit E [Oscillospiraceae bacterium]
MNKRQNLLKGIIKENPVLVLVLGTCPTLAVTTNVMSALGMGAAATIVLLCSNVVISALRNIIPDKVRIPCYIVLIAGFVTMVQMLVKAFAPALDEALGIFLPLIVVNCIILGRAEMFANKNKVIDSAIDAVGMGAGFTLALFLMATIREVLGNGTWLGISIPILAENNISIMTMAPGGFLVFGILIAIVNKISGGKNTKKSFGCTGCPSAEACNKASCVEKEEAK